MSRSLQTIQNGTTASPRHHVGSLHEVSTLITEKTGDARAEAPHTPPTWWAILRSKSMLRAVIGTGNDADYCLGFCSRKALMNLSTLSITCGRISRRRSLPNAPSASTPHVAVEAMGIVESRTRLTC